MHVKYQKEEKDIPFYKSLSAFFFLKEIAKSHTQNNEMTPKIIPEIGL